MDGQVYRLRIALRGGTIIEADVMNPVIELNAERTRLQKLDWQNPSDLSHPVTLAYVDVAEIVAITLEEQRRGRVTF